MCSNMVCTLIINNGQNVVGSRATAELTLVRNKFLPLWWCVSKSTDHAKPHVFNFYHNIKNNERNLCQVKFCPDMKESTQGTLSLLL